MKASLAGITPAAIALATALAGCGEGLTLESMAEDESLARGDPVSVARAARIAFFWRLSGYACSGTIVAPRIALATADCLVKGRAPWTVPLEQLVVVGGASRPINYVIHPDYQPGNAAHNIALVVLDGESFPEPVPLRRNASCPRKIEIVGRRLLDQGSVTWTVPETKKERSRTCDDYALTTDYLPWLADNTSTGTNNFGVPALVDGALEAMFVRPLVRS